MEKLIDRYIAIKNELMERGVFNEVEIVAAILTTITPDDAYETTHAQKLARVQAVGQYIPRGDN